MLLGIQQKKGDAQVLCGKLIAYARILPSTDNDGAPTPFQEMVRNGLLVVEGDFRANNTFKQFLRKELGRDFDQNIAGLIERIKDEGGEIPEGLDVDAIRERVNELSNMEVIPIPAKITHHESEEEILKAEGDIYYIGEFQGVGQAHFCLTSLPIYYQAKYREQEKINEQRYLGEILSQIETQKVIDTAEIKDASELFPEGATLNSFIGNLQEVLDTRVIPFFMAQESTDDFECAWSLFATFMQPYQHKADIENLKDAIVNLRANQADATARRRLELYCNKISAVYHENFRKIPEIMQELAILEG